ncbi:endosome/lysosome-associated apoptosis and autophagy regulator family member 2-like [Styela clava]
MVGFISMTVFLGVFLSSMSFVKTDKVECVDDMITYRYTECDSSNNRWRVAVPRNDECEIKNPLPPVFGRECGFSCSKGEYLDLDSQECKMCPTGTYSLGSGVRYNSWDKIPDGFSVSSSSFTFAEYGYHAKVDDCTTSVWNGQKDYISSNDNDCTSTLSYSVDVKTTGSVSFTYQYPDEDLIFHFYIQNGECQTLHTNGKNLFLNTTGTSWKTYQVDLDQGTNVLIWKTTGLLLGEKERISPALIKDIEISGVSYTTNCHRCEAGFFADAEGSHWCKPCDANTHSDVNAKECTPCDTLTQYAPVASPNCIDKPACTEHDYFETHSPCDENKTTKVMYKWREPKICNEDGEGAIKLPASDTTKECPPCNLGFHQTESGTCSPCNEGQFSNGKEECQECPVGTAPNYGFFYTWWDVIPKNINVSCLTVHSEHCIGTEGWVASGSMIQTSQMEIPVAYLLLKLHIDGFRSFKVSPEGSKVYGSITFVFEMSCSKGCVMYLMRNVHGFGTNVVDSWHGKKEKQTYTMDVVRNETMTLSWAFQKTSVTSPEMKTAVAKDRAIIYSITVTNAIGAPADQCHSCAAGANDAGCIPCPAGHFIEPDSKKCLPCPSNTILPFETTHNAQCTECNEGTTSNKAHTACKNDCTFLSNTTGREYDLSFLSKPQIASTPPSFTSTGRKYVHFYNFSICGNEGLGDAECFDNKSLSRNLMYGVQKVKGMICRSTKLNSLGSTNRAVPVFSQPQVISHVLERVFQQDLNATKPDDSVEDCNEGNLFFPISQYQLYGDIIYVFGSNVNSSECPSGMKSFVHLRCDPNITEENTKIEMPAKYPEGSCDGCFFHFLIRSSEACPLCTADDYFSLEGACKDSVITTRYMWKSYPKACKDGVSLPDYTKTHCMDYKLYIEIGILGGVVLFVILLAILCSIWKKSRKLEYKYQKLMDSGKNGGELPAAETCAISSSESEDDESEEVMFRKKREKMLGKKTKENEKIPLNTMHHSINM